MSAAEPAAPAGQESGTPQARGRRGNLARRVVLGVVLAGLLVSALSYTVSLTTEYARARERLAERFQRMEQTDLPLLTLSAWTANTAMAQVQLEGLVNRPYISYAELELDGGQVLHAGQHEGPDPVRREFALVHGFGEGRIQVGRLTVEASFEEAETNIRRTAALLLGAQAVTAVLSIGLILLLFHLSIYRRLRVMSAYAEALSRSTLDRPLELPGAGGGSGDELDLLAGAMNAMRENLRQSLDELSRANARLQAEVAERAQAQEDLARTNEMLFSSQGMAHLGSWELEPSSGQLFWSGEAYRIFGLYPGSFPCTYEAFLQAVHPEDRDMVARAYGASLAPGSEGYEVEHRIVRPGGEVRVVHERCTHERDESGRVVRSVGMVHDITEGKRAEEALARERRVLDGIVEGTSDAVFVKDRQGRYLRVNSETARVMGRAVADILGRDDTEIFPREEALVIMALDRRVMEGGEVQTGEEHVTTVDGPRTYLATKGPLVGEGGEVLGLFGISRDITERKRMEQDLLAAKEAAEAASLAKSAFLANMSHEIRTPLNGIMGMLQLMQQDLPQGAAGHQAEFLEAALGSTRRLTALLTDILDLAKVESRRLALRAAPFRVREMVGSVCDLLGLTARDKGLDLAWAVDDAVPHTLIGDEARLRQVLFNLLGNALKFTERGGVSLAVRLDGPAGAEPLAVRFTVTDTGVGIPAHRISEIFQPFTQVDSSYVRRQQGAGLGMAIVKGLVELMRGDIDVQSVEGRGTTVSLRLRFLGVEAAAAANGPGGPNGSGEPPQARPAECLAGLRVLLVEDEAVNRLAMTHLLERAGCRVVMAGDGIQALERLEEQDFDVALMDVQMPEMDGLSATRAIRAREADRGLPHMPVVALTAYAMTGDRERFLAAGMDDYLPKPLEMGLLLAVLGRIRAQRAGAQG